MVQSPKEKYVREMFASIAPRYDLLNSLLSFNRHRYWRRFAVEKCELRPGDSALDVGVGTGDLAIELARAVSSPTMLGRELDSLPGNRPGGGSPTPSPTSWGKSTSGTLCGRVVGVDFCHPMLDLAAQKLNRRGIANVILLEGNAEALPVPSNSFRAATTGFTLRNVGNIEIALAEMTRAVEPGGRVVVLELAEPTGPVFRRIYHTYFRRLLPLIGGVISGGRGSVRATAPGSDGASPSQNGGPYDYLPASVASFASREELKAVMEKVGLADVKVYDLTAGIVAIHVGIKE